MLVNIGFRINNYVTSELHDCSAEPFLDSPSANFFQADALQSADAVTATATAECKM